MFVGVHNGDSVAICSCTIHGVSQVLLSELGAASLLLLKSSKAFGWHMRGIIFLRLVFNEVVELLGDQEGVLVEVGRSTFCEPFKHYCGKIKSLTSTRGW